MAITVRHDRDLGSAYAQALAESRRRQQQPQAYADPNEDPRTDANPFTLTQDEGRRINASLRGDRERLGQQQKEKYGEDAYKDSYAGFNWQNPITIWQDEKNGVRTGKVVYENLGVDPLATGGFGALGSGEKHVYDYNQTIDTRNAEDLKKLGDVAGGGYGRSQTVPYDTFYSEREKKQAEEGRQRAIANEQWFERQKQTDAMRDENEALKDQRRTEENMRKERARADRERQNNAARQSIINQAKLEGDESTIQASEAMINSIVDSLSTGTAQGYILSPSDSMEVRSAQNEVSRIKRDPGYSTKTKAQAIEALFKRLSKISPVRSIDPRETPEQQSAREFNEWKMREDYRNANKPEKPRYSESEWSAMENALKRGKPSTFQPSPEAIQAALDARKNQVEQANSAASGQVYEVKSQDIGQALQEVQSLPRGAKFKDPISGQILEKM